MTACCGNGETTSSYPLYKRRWAYLLLLATLQLPGGFSFVCFGQMSKIFVVFFQITYVEVDWLTLSINLSAIMLAVPFSLAVFYKWGGLRRMCMTIGLCYSLGYICICASLAKSTLFPLAFVGQLLNGVASTLLLALPPIFAALWFPEEQVGTAIGVNVMSFYSGCVLGLTVPQSVLHFHAPNGTQNFTEYLVEDRKMLACIFGSFVIVAILSTICIFLYVADRPPTPPTEAQAAKTANAAIDATSPTFWSYIQTVKSLLHNKTYLLGSVTFGILFQISTVEVTMTAQIFSQMFVGAKASYNASVIGGHIVAAFYLGSLVGSLVAAKLVDKYKRYKFIAVGSCLLSSVFSLGVLAGFVVNWIPLIFVGILLFGIISQPGLVAIYDVTTQETYPTDETFVSIWLTAIQNAFAIFFAEVGRALFLSSGGLAVLVFQSAVLLVGTSLSGFFSPHNKRLNLQIEKEVSGSEETALLTTMR